MAASPSALRQHNYAGTWKFCPQCEQSLHTGGSGKPHERDIWLVAAIFLDCVRSAGRVCNFHVSGWEARIKLRPAWKTGWSSKSGGRIARVASSTESALVGGSHLLRTGFYNLSWDNPAWHRKTPSACRKRPYEGMGSKRRKM